MIALYFRFDPTAGDVHGRGMSDAAADIERREKLILACVAARDAADAASEAYRAARETYFDAICDGDQEAAARAKHARDEANLKLAEQAELEADLEAELLVIGVRMPPPSDRTWARYLSMPSLRNAVVGLSRILESEK